MIDMRLTWRDPVEVYPFRLLSLSDQHPLTASMTDADFDSLPRFDARDFEPPAWASSSKFSWGKEKNGESSKTTASPFDAPFNSNGDDNHSVDDDHGDNEVEDAEEIWEDASEGHSVMDLKETVFTTEELQVSTSSRTSSFETDRWQEALALAQQLKSKGNASFTSKPPDHQAAVQSYRSAIAILPPCPRKEPVEKTKPAVPPLVEGQSGIQEVTEEEAAAIQAESKQTSRVEDDQETEREKVEKEVRELTKACWGNLAACYIALVRESDDDMCHS